jgi:hypothetical protein
MRLGSLGPAGGRRMRTVRDVVRFGAVILTGPVSRYSVRSRGDEARRRLPGDELLPAANDRWTHAVTIRGRPEDIWPWLAQMGCRRAGWYSYDGLDNGGVRSAERVLPALQSVEVGDVFPWTSTAEDGFVVYVVEPGRVLVLGGDAGTLYRVRWAFLLEPIDATRTRLLTRASAEYDRFAVALRLRLFGRPVHFAMQRRQLLNVRRRVHAAAG